MSEIRKRSLKAATWIYFGFFIGAVNTYLFTHKNWFTTDQYGLTRSLLELSMLMCAFSTLGVTNFLIKFFPYYHDNLENKKNDILSFATLISLLGFIVTVAGLIIFKPLAIKKLGTTSPLLIEYFFYIIPLTFFILMYNVLEAYAYGFNKGILTSLLKETILRFYTTIIVVLKVFDWINFETFMLLFSLQFAIIFIILFIILKKENNLWYSFKFSRVTKRFRKKIIAILGFTFIVIIVNVLRQSIDGLVLAAKQGLDKVGIFGFSAYLVSVMQAPLRSIVAITVPILSRAWKDKNTNEINRIYYRSSINLLTFALFIFFLIWLNFGSAIDSFGMNPDYHLGKWVFFILGIVTIIEMGTGVNGQIIGTSTFWRFELWTSLLLTILILPLSYTLTIKYGILGPALANLISFTIYNFSRYWFLYKKFNMQPFNGKTIEVILIAFLSYTTTYLLFFKLSGWTSLFVNTIVFSIIYLSLVIYRNISPDSKPIISNLINKLKNN